MWGALIGAGLGAGLGAYKAGEDKKRADRDRQLQSQIAAYSPWTGMQAHPVQEGPGMTGGILQGAAGGVGLGQAFDTSSAQEGMQAKQGQLIDAQTNAINNGSAGAYNGQAGNSPFVEGPRQYGTISR